MTLLFLKLFYYLLFPFLFLAILPFHLLKMVRRGGYRDCFLQRLGIFDAATLQRIGQGRLWIHAVSVGELFIALKWIEEWQKRHPDQKVLLSVTTSTAMALAQQKASPQLEVIANPIDFWLTTKILIKRFAPKILLFIEADLWPARIWAAQRAQIPVGLLNARLSPRSEARFKKFTPLVTPFFNQLDFITFPTPYDQERWQRLGVTKPQQAYLGNMKYDTPASTNNLEEEEQKKKVIANIWQQLGWGTQDPLLLGGSTHPGEEEILLAAWEELHHNFPNLRLLLAPRHVERTPELITLLTKKNLSYRTRSQLGNLTTPSSKQNLTTQPPPSLLLLDTTGELSFWYSQATVVFIGKSLPVAKNKGGQNLVEPLQAGAAVITGPHMENFEPLISELRKANALHTITDQATLVEATSSLLKAASVRKNLLEKAHSILSFHQGATTRTCHFLESCQVLP